MATTNTQGPTLGITWQTSMAGLLIAHSDSNIKKWDFSQNNVVNIGKHAHPVKDLYEFTNNNTTILVSGGWDARVKFWTWTSPT